MNRKMNWRPVFRYSLRDFLTGGAIVCGVLAAIAGITVAVEGVRAEGTVQLNGASMSMMIMLFVYGIVGPRPCLRLSAQFGVSRRTAFLGMNLAALVSAVMLAAAIELLTAAAGLSKGVTYQEFYQMTYLHGAKVVTWGQHLTSVLLNIALMMALFFLGMIFTALFWRLNKIGVIAAVAVMLLVINGLPMACVRSASGRRAAMAFFHWIGHSVWNLAGFCVIFAAAAAAISWLLIRTANIKAPAGK